MSNISSVYVPDNMGGNNVESMLLGSMMGGGGGFGGMNGGVWPLIYIMAFRGIFGDNYGNGNGNGNRCQLSQIQEQLQTIQGQNTLMSAITGGTNEVRSLANTINCDVNAVQAAINAVQSAICNLGSQNGMNFMQVINSINSGNASLANTLQSCCCDVKQLVTQQGYENRINNIEQTNTITKGFGDIAYATQAQTTALAANNDANTRAVLAKLDQIEDDRKNREINALTAENATLRSRAERQSELAPIYQQLNDIKCKQPETVTVPYSPITPVPSCVAWNAALYGGFPYAQQARGNVFS